MSSDHKLLDTYDRISSSKATERGNALTELKHLLSQRRNAGTLNDKGFHRMYEAIFKAAVIEKNLFDKQAKGTMKSTLATRLQTCGSVLRAAVELGVKHLKVKTVRAVYQHILDILPVGRAMCEPISTDYLKALRVLLQYAPHTEHLLPDEWEALAGFCCAHVKAQLGFSGENDEGDVQMVEVEDRNPRSRGSMLVRENSTPSRRFAGGSGSHLQPTVRLSHESEELLLCLRSLLATSNAPVLGNIKPVCDVLLGFLRSQSTYTRAHQHVFVSLNYVLNVATTNDLKIVSRVSEEIISIVSRLWDTKSPGFKDEMIISLMHCQPYIRATIRASTGHALRMDVETLFETLCNEYISRSDREMLQLEDLSFPISTEQPPTAAPLSLRAISLRPNTQYSRSEQAWMIPYLLALLVEMLDLSGDLNKRSPEDSHPAGTRKRQRMYDRASEMMRFARSNMTPRKLLALQVMSFLADLKGVNEDDFPSIMQDLQEICSDDNSAITGWALVAMGSCAFLRCASHPSYSKLWIHVWQLCARYATSQATCRIACHIMRILISQDLITYPGIAKDVDSMLQSIDINGPAILCDSSLALWRLILAKRSTVVHSNHFDPGERLFQWCSSKWRPVQDIMEKSQHTSALDVVNFLMACCGIEPVHRDQYPHFVCGSIGQACYRSVQYHALRSMLLNDEASNDAQPTPSDQALASEASNPNTRLQAQVVEFLDRKVAQMHEKWASLFSQKQGISSAVMQNVVRFILVSSVFSSKAHGPAASRAMALTTKLEETLVADLDNFLSTDDCSQKHIDGLLFALHDFLPTASGMLRSTKTSGHNFYGAAGMLLTIVADKLDVREKAVSSFNAAESKDEMDIDAEAFGFSSHERSEEKTGRDFYREEVEALSSEETFRASTSALVALCALSLKDIAETSDICGQFVAYLREVNKSRLIMMGPVVQDFLSIAGDHLIGVDAADICDHLAGELLQGYDVERCETSVTLCVDALAALVSKWVVSPSQNVGNYDLSSGLLETCEEVYIHLIKIGLEKQVTSYKVRASIAGLLERILHVNPEYRKGPQASVELFINILKDHDVRVMFSVTERLHVLFKIFGEQIHLKLTEDIEAALPSTRDWTEGLAMRVYALGSVALASLSNISRIVYRIFETGQLPPASQYASRALFTVAKASGLDSQRGLFKLFGAKLIFTWTEYYELADFAAEVFGYDSLVELCEDMPAELIAQLLAKGKDDCVEFVASQLEKPLDDLLIQAFARVVAYGLAWAVGYPPLATQEGHPPRLPLSVWIRKRLGDDTYAQLFSKNFPVIISILLELMHEEGNSERLLSRDPNLVDVYQIMKDMTAEGYSDRKLAQQVEPHFRPKVVLNAIHHACTVMEVDDKHDLWTPAMVTFVARRMFDTLHPALGPVHTCGVIRNIRLLICLAGSRVHDGYPLQMLIHGLKPYVIDTACAEDAIGILRYLLKNGREYLARNPPFVIGTFLSILTSIRQFTRSSTTAFQPDKEADFALAAVQSFHSWLADYLTNFAFPTLKPKQNEAFQAIVESAVGFRRNGNAKKGTKESELLRHLLDDDISEDKLLDDVSRQLAFSLSCSNFMRPESFRDDIFGTDKASFERSKSLLRICRSSEVNDGFLLWSARVLGRAYASTGQLHTDWMLEMEFGYPTDEALASDMIPKVGILRRLKALLFSDDKAVVALMEATLTQIINDESMSGEDTFTHVLAADEYKALQWSQSPTTPVPTRQPIEPFGEIQAPANIWIKDVAAAMCASMPNTPIIKGLFQPLQHVDGLAAELFPYITHILLVRGSASLRADISKLFQLCLQHHDEKTVPRNTILIKTILYLRSQPRQGKEKNECDRDSRLEINYLEAAKAACVCKMFKTALLFTEIFYHKDPSVEIPPALMLDIFKNIDDPDSFYGVSQTFNLETIMNRFEYEGNGWKSLSLRAANLESGIRLGEAPEEESLGIIDSFNTLGMNGLSHSFLQCRDFASSSSGRNLDNIYRSAWKLEQWDLPCPVSCNTRSASVYRALQTVNNTIGSKPIPLHVDPHFLSVMKQITAGTQTGHTLAGGMRTLAMLTEMEEVFISKDKAELDEVWDRLQTRSKWMETGKYVDVEEMMAMRQATFGSLAKRDHLRTRASVNVQDARYMEARALVGCCKMARKHEVLQHALLAATQLNHIVQPCKDVGLDISGVATLQAANVLWEDGQEFPSVRMLLDLEGDSKTSSQSMVVGRAKLLAKLGSRISAARLEKADKIMSHYLEKAIVELKQNDTGAEAGRVFHEFASFCDQQLKNPNNVEDYERALKLKQDKEAEVHELAKLIKQGAHSVEAKTALARENNKARSWLALDEAEYNRLKNARDAFLEKSVSNYLKCLAACDDYDGDAVRFTALWLANSEQARVNTAASDLDMVPSRKLVPLMNQLSSRLLSKQGQQPPGQSDLFQRLLLRLIVKICQEHPYHGIYQILALSKTRALDEVSVSRQQAALQALELLKGGSRRSKRVVTALDSTTRAYEKLAHADVDEKKEHRKTSFTALLKDSKDQAKRFERDIPSYGIPPPTMHIDIRPDCDYSKLPGITRFDPIVSLASGLSMPKVINCEASDGTVFKELVKGGQDDLRQDAIMEQVFEQVSGLLQKGRITGQRNLNIRTYKVIPLTTSSGIIEFVPNTTPLHEYLLPAHAKYFPSDWKASTCRTAIINAQPKSREKRVMEFKRVMKHFRPVMHFFFMHEFNGPDAWYTSRLAYTRSTAAISILGHVLGLGDRHGHNILLDTKTGEVVHIDLGVAFEQGRILPVPEVVPFRLTRDIVAGMGVTKTEGVFRRCCEFTLEVLRNEASSITTILDVLRYDPLYSWSMSPLRMKRMQDNHLEVSMTSERSIDGVAKPKKAESESEADRALTVVAKKLSKTLSVSATVNELIQQASDERNLAVLYAGWAAYA
ncbi:hypothetical protein FN846DRAFT_923968 [Sphaerosporella brunnea]|uniref:Serine/threonine-protein kinase Tel1 n=1 Tax=Sphaerosporella brunnea TaxID=1250544 RepID=A0A5J5ECK8_9PEZI|nr:hypothetical protein FN846DRAFT_923968 [Sphaerosporella brunnea]